MKFFILLTLTFFSLQSFSQTSPNFRKRIVSGTIFFSDSVTIEGQKIYATLLIPEKLFIGNVSGIVTDPLKQQEFLFHTVFNVITENNMIKKNAVLLSYKNKNLEPNFSNLYYSEWKNRSTFLIYVRSNSNTPCNE